MDDQGQGAWVSRWLERERTIWGQEWSVWSYLSIHGRGYEHESAVAVVLPLLPDKRWRIEMEMGDEQIGARPRAVSHRLVVYHAVPVQTVPQDKTVPYPHS